MPYPLLHLREDRGLPALGHVFRCRPRQATSILHEHFAVPLDFVRGFLLNGFRRPSRTVPLLPRGSTCSRRTHLTPLVPGMAGYSCPPAASARSPPLHVQQSDPSELGHTRACTPLFCIVTPPRRCRTRGPRPCRAAPARCSACSCSSACRAPASRALARTCCARAEPRPSHRVHLRASQCLHTPPALLGSRACASPPQALRLPAASASARPAACPR
jgi:hypothetical protein